MSKMQNSWMQKNLKRFEKRSTKLQTGSSISEKVATIDQTATPKKSINHKKWQKKENQQGTNNDDGTNKINNVSNKKNASISTTAKYENGVVWDFFNDEPGIRTGNDEANGNNKEKSGFTQDWAMNEENSFGNNSNNKNDSKNKNNEKLKKISRNAAQIETISKKEQVLKKLNSKRRKDRIDNARELMGLNKKIKSKRKSTKINEKEKERGKDNLKTKSKTEQSNKNNNDTNDSNNNNNETNNEISNVTLTTNNNNKDNDNNDKNNNDNRFENRQMIGLRTLDDNEIDTRMANENDNNRKLMAKVSLSDNKERQKAKKTNSKDNNNNNTNNNKKRKGNEINRIDETQDEMNVMGMQQMTANKNTNNDNNNNDNDNGGDLEEPPLKKQRLLSKNEVTIEEIEENMSNHEIEKMKEARESSKARIVSNNKNKIDLEESSIMLIGGSLRVIDNDDNDDGMSEYGTDYESEFEGELRTIDLGNENTGTANNNNNKKKESETSFYWKHWNRNIKSRNDDILPLLAKRVGTPMKKIDLPKWFTNVKTKENNNNNNNSKKGIDTMTTDRKDHLLFIDNDTEAFEIHRNIKCKQWQCDEQVIEAYKMKRKEFLTNLQNNNNNKHGKSKTKNKNINFSENQLCSLTANDSLLFSSMQTYRDVWYSGRSYKNDKRIKEIISMHMVNHVLKNEKRKNENTNYFKMLHYKRKEQLYNNNNNKQNENENENLKSFAESLKSNANENENENSDNDETKKMNDNNDENEDIDVTEEEIANTKREEADIRDSGFRNTNILVITPFKESARLYGEYILNSLPQSRKKLNQRYKRFCQEYGTWDSRNKSKPKGKGKEFSETFSGDIKDDFWCGIALGKNGVLFHQNWKDSQIMLISPLRLRLTLEKRRTKDGGSILDYFSSIEMVIVDMADIISMQNWDHLNEIYKNLNWRPKLKRKKDLSNVDFSRLRYCYVNNHSNYYRQNIMISSYMSPNMKMLFNNTNNSFCNIFGRIKIRLKYNGILDCIIPMIKQHFHRFNINDANNIIINANKNDDTKEMLNLVFDSDASDESENEYNNNNNNNNHGDDNKNSNQGTNRFKKMQNDIKLRKKQAKLKMKQMKKNRNENKDDNGENENENENEENLSEELKNLHEARFLMYKEHILPVFRKTQLKTLIFVQSYFDFLRLRRLYRNVNTIRFISEYTEDSEANKYRRDFRDEKKDINYLVITERYYFYNRLRCEGAQRTIFYGLPDNCQYYVDILNWMSTQQQWECYSLYCKYDSLALERIVGTKRMMKMLTNVNDIQIFV